MSLPKSKTEYWKKCETVEILSRKRERIPSKKQQAIEEDNDTPLPDLSTQITSKIQSINKDTPPKQKKSNPKKKAKSKQQNVPAAASRGEPEVEAEAAAVVGECVTEGEAVGECVKVDAAVSVVTGAEVAQEGAMMKDKNTNMRAASEIDEDPIDLEAFEQELK